MSDVPRQPSRPLRIAVIAGDGIGREVIPAGLDVVTRAAAAEGGTFDITAFPWGCEFYRRTGRMMDGDALDALQTFDAIYLGAVGDPSVPDHVSVWELILPIRQRFEQYVNLRPMRLLPSVAGPLAGRSPADIDMVCVRENSEGEYSGVGGRLHVGTPYEVAEQTSLFTHRGIERIARYAFELAARRPRQTLASATKSNAMQHTMVLWDEVVEEVARDFPQVTWCKYHVDALAARMVTHPQTLDVIVASNLFGDILTDLGAAVSGSLGVAPGANIDPSHRFPSMFEPIHGSAPDIAGRGIANPIGAIWAGALMLQHLGLARAHDRIVGAIEHVLQSGGPRTPISAAARRRAGSRPLSSPPSAVGGLSAYGPRRDPARGEEDTFVCRGREVVYGRSAAPRPMEATIAGLLASAEGGDPRAAEALFSALYAELHRIARRELRRRGGGLSLGATTLLHEAYLDIAGRAGPDFPDRNRFVGYAARVMRGLIINYARSRRAQKRGGLFEITAIGTAVPEAVPDPRELAGLGDALDELAGADPLLAQVVDLKFFCGFSFAEIAAMRGVSERTVQRDWQKARIHLHRALRGAASLR